MRAAFAANHSVNADPDVRTHLIVTSSDEWFRTSMMRWGGSPARARLVAAEWRRWCGVKRSPPACWAVSARLVRLVGLAKQALFLGFELVFG